MQFKTCVAIWTISFVIIMDPESVQGFPSFWDGIPLISQGKSLIQVISGDAEGAKRTQENFTKQMPIISQARSTVEKVMGNFEDAQKTEEQFITGFVEPIVDNTPGVGHVKGAIHMATGDMQRGEEIMKGATKNGLIAIGTMVGGAGGAISTSLMTDKLYTAVDSARANEYKPYGFEEYVQNIDKKSAGEHVDQWVELVLTGKKGLKNSNNN